MFIKRTCVAAIVACLGLLGGCVSLQVDDHSYQFNKATGSLNLRLLLLNAVRASKDYPLQFSKISGYSGKGAVSGTVSATLPLSGTGTLMPKVDWNDGVSRLDLIDLNTEEAQQALKKTLPLRVYRYFDAYGGNRSYVTPVMLIVEHVAMPRRLYNLIGRYVKNERCSLYLSERASRLNLPRFAHNVYACTKLRELETQCKDLGQHLLAHPDVNVALLRNHVTTRCEHVAFVAGTLYLAIVGGTVGSAQKFEGDRGAGRGGRRDSPPSSTKKAPGNTFNIFAVESKDREKGEPDKEPIILPFYDQVFAARCAAARLCVRRPGMGVLARDVQIQLRSPERMVRFLGELISAQTHGPERFVPFAYDPIRQEEYDLLRVKQGIPTPGAAAVSVVGPDGETIYVPRRDHSTPKTHLSLEILSIVSDVLNGAVSKKAYPPVTTLTVTGP